VLPSAETALIAPLLLQGYTVVVAAPRGGDADFAAGPEYGPEHPRLVAGQLRSPATGIGSTAKTALLGYSGGAIATSGRRAAPAYAPDVNRHLIGAGLGGCARDPAQICTT